LPPAFALFLGPEAKLPDDVDQLSQIYRSQLSGERVLIVLDNAEDSAQVRALQPPHGNALLVTSRSALALPGITRVALGQLQPAEAQALLTGIAPRAAPDVADEICLLCGYLPLAIRAAGSLLDVTVDLDPSEYAAQLRDERTRLERIGGEGVDAGIEASFNLTYERLQPEAARVFRNLAVFPASFDAASEEEVCADPGHVHLSELVRRSLVLYEEAAKRYRLHDLVRLFADSRLTAAERAATQRLHAAHYNNALANAQSLYLEGGEGVARGLALFDLEWGNIRAGQAWALAQGGTDDEAAQLSIAYAEAGVDALSLRQHAREIINWLDTSLTAARRLKHRSSEGHALGNLGNAYSLLGETRRAVELYKQQLVIVREIGDRRGEGAALGNLGVAYANLGETRRAIEFYEQALFIDREIGDRRGEGATLGNLGVAYANLGETRRAIEFYEQYLVIACETGDRRGEGSALGNLGVAYADLGETRRAIEFYEQQLVIVREIGDRRGEGNALGNLGNAYSLLGEIRRAIEFYEQALVIDRETGHRRGEGADLGNLGTAYKLLGEIRRAIEFYEQRLVIACAIGDRRGEGNALWNMSLALEVLDDRAQAIVCAEQALTIYEHIEDPNAAQAREQLAKWREETSQE
jgi:tetratricopeptide (TPR) repeat protein